MIFFIYQLYLLQLENYEIGRFWQLLLKKGYFGPKDPLRKSLVWTKKALSIFLLSLILWLLVVILFLASDIYSAIAVGLILIFLFPLLYTVALIILMPVDAVLKYYLINKTRTVIKNAKDLKIIGIAGSYGKTTMKAVLKTVLLEKFNVLSTPESINTPVGIAGWFLKNYTKKTEILIIEMGEHYRGDIQYLCSVTKPDISVVTGINEAHLERLKSLENASATIFELVQNSKKDALIVLNADDDNVVEAHKNYVGERKALFYCANDNNQVKGKISNAKFNDKELVWQFDFESIKGISVPMIGRYILGNAMAASLIGESLGMTPEEIKKGLLKVTPVEHRLQPIKGQGDVLVIDDSYNGNPDGVLEAIKTLDYFKDRRKVFITPGLVESGSANTEIHQQIGKQLAKVADKVILIKNSATPYIADGLKQEAFNEENIIWFDTADEAHKSLGQILKPNDVILFQNDWGDQYL